MVEDKIIEESTGEGTEQAPPPSPPDKGAGGLEEPP